MSEDTPRFQPLGRYESPSLPPEKAAKRMLDRVRGLILPSETPPVIDASDLDRVGRRELDEIAAPPACGPLLESLTATFGAWLADPERGSPLQLVVLPPCDEGGLLAAWGREQGLEILAPPSRGALTGRAAAKVPDLSGPGVLMIPALEAWFLRTNGGLAPVRALLAALARTDRRCIVGCNSWAWRYLCKSTDADALLPAGLTFRAFDGPRLQRWFGDLSEDMDEVASRFRLSRTGTDVFADETVGRQNYFVQLAAQSLGIPWIAWAMWRDAIRDAPDADDLPDLDDLPDDDGHTYWIASPETFVLPVDREEDVILTLHALLLHGRLTPEELVRVLPTVGDRNTVPALLKARLIRRADGALRCNPVAYPSVRSALSDAGVNLDRL